MLRTIVAQAAGKLRWFSNRLFQRCLRRRPVFHDIDATFPALRAIDRSYEVIREELLAVLPRRHRIPRYHEVDPSQDFISEGERDWRMLYLHMQGAGSDNPNRELCPRTVALVEQVPDVCGASFSILDPGKSIPPHSGPYLGYLRYHLGLVVPADNPPSIRIKDEHYTWKEGESVFFDDSFEHEVFNEAAGIRVVLIVDLLRPMAWPLDALNRLVGWLSSCKTLHQGDWATMALRG